MKNTFIISYVLMISLSGCSGLKVVDPNEKKNEGMKQLDFSDGKLRLVDTYTCTMVAANGKRIYANGKSEEDARKELIAKCHDQTIISFCEKSKLQCKKN